MTDHDIEPDRALVACMPVTGSPTAPFPSEVVKCLACGQDVWVSRTLYPRVRDGQLEPACLSCLPSFPEVAQDGIEIRIHPAQEQELADAGLLGRVRELIEQLNRLQDNES